VKVVLGPEPLSAAAVIAVARHGEHVVLGSTGRAAMERSRAHVDVHAAGDTPVYGISTGFGALAVRRVPPEDRLRLQHSVVRSHAAGMGPAVEPEVVRAMMVLRARTLATGYCGARPELCDALVALLNAGITPVVPEHGSLGCSGDLAPLSHVGAALIGEGDVELDGDCVPAATALARRGLAPIALEAKEGLALINGTDGMLGMLVLACTDARALLQTADVGAAMSIEALLGTDRVFDPALQQLRPHPGQRASAANIAALVAGSPMVESHREGDVRVQDAYSLRCAPQVLGAARDTLGFCTQVADRELAAAIDTWSSCIDGRVESNGNFHGAPLGLVCDYLAIALAEAGAIAERRIDRLLDAHRSHGLPPFLADDPGVDSGLMIAHYTAAAHPIDTWSSCMADVGSESTLAGAASLRFSATRAAAV
jgi:histidine ammonia-lyase